MGVFELFVHIVIIALLGYIAVWVVGKLAPGHPTLLDNVIWVIVVLVIIVTVVRAFGILDPQIPRLR